MFGKCDLYLQMNTNHMGLERYDRVHNDHSFFIFGVSNTLILRNVLFLS